MDVTAHTASQVKKWWSVEDFNHIVNPLGHCWECNTPGHVRPDKVYSDRTTQIDVQQRGLRLHSQSARTLLGMQSARTCKDKVSKARTIQDEL